MSDREDAEELLRAAARDLRALRGMSDPEVFADELFGFIAQQAAEKCLKAWLCALGRTYPLTHDLTALLLRLEDCGQDTHDYLDLTDLNPFAVLFRYAAMPGTSAALHQKEMVRRLLDLFEHVTHFVNSLSSD